MSTSWGRVLLAASDDCSISVVLDRFFWGQGFMPVGWPLSCKQDCGVSEWFQSGTGVLGLFSRAKNGSIH